MLEDTVCKMNFETLNEMSNEPSYTDPFTSDNQFDQKLLQFTDFGSLDDLYFNVVSPPFQFLHDETINPDDSATQDSDNLVESNTKRPCLPLPKSLKILEKYSGRLRRLGGDKMNFPSYETQCYKISSQKLSTEAIIRLAAKEFIGSNPQLDMHSDPNPSAILGRSDIELVQNLLHCVEKLGKKQYERANRILLDCDKMSSNTGSPVQRLAFYFVEALYEKIDRETGKSTLGKMPSDPQEVLKSPTSTQIAFHKVLPFPQVVKFAGIQAIVEHVAESRKIHIIDLEIRNGIHCIILMQALAARAEPPLEHLRITAVGTNSRHRIEVTGRYLTSFAQSLNLKFSFNIVVVENILDLNEKFFDLEQDESIAVYAAFTLMNWISRPHCLDKLMRLIQTLNPRILIVTEVEANCNSPIFVDRFVEALFFYGAYFDSLADCLKDDEQDRRVAESTCFRSAIRNIVAAEGDERKIRHVSIDVWRAYFSHFGFAEVELSMSSLYQANLVLENFLCGGSCTFDMKGKSLIIGWKGTPLSSLSAWKFR